MHARSRARDVKMAPSRFVCRVCEMSSGEVLARMLERDIPAALIRMSTFACTISSVLHYSREKLTRLFFLPFPSQDHPSMS